MATVFWLLLMVAMMTEMAKAKYDEIIDSSTACDVMCFVV